MIIRRFRSDEIGSFGTLEIDGAMFFTVGQPWKDNEPFNSCIPEGDYTLVPHESKKYGQVLAFVGETVSHYKDPDFKRYACLIHAGNYPGDVSGCIALGDNYIQNKSMVTNSKKSIKRFYDIISPLKEHKITIENAAYL